MATTLTILWNPHFLLEVHHKRCLCAQKFYDFLLHVIKLLLLCFSWPFIFLYICLTLIQLSQRRVTWRVYIPPTTTLLPLLLHLSGHHPCRAPAASPAASVWWGFWSHSTSSSLFAHMLCFFPSIQRASPRKIKTHRVIHLSLSSPTPLLPLHCVSWESSFQMISFVSLSLPSPINWE